MPRYEERGPDVAPGNHLLKVTDIEHTTSKAGNAICKVKFIVAYGPEAGGEIRGFLPGFRMTLMLKAMGFPRQADPKTGRGFYDAADEEIIGRHVMCEIGTREHNGRVYADLGEFSEPTKAMIDAADDGDVPF